MTLWPAFDEGSAPLIRTLALFLTFAIGLGSAVVGFFLVAGSEWGLVALGVVIAILAWVAASMIGERR